MVPDALRRQGQSERVVFFWWWLVDRLSRARLRDGFRRETLPVQGLLAGSRAFWLHVVAAARLSVVRSVPRGLHCDAVGWLAAQQSR